MDVMRKYFYGPTPEEQKREFGRSLRRNLRELDTEFRRLQILERKTRNQITEAWNRAQRNPSRQKQASYEIRTKAEGLIGVRKQLERVSTNKVTLESILNQVDLQFATRKMAGSLNKATEIIKEVNKSIQVPELTRTVNELSRELLKAGIIAEMTDDAMPDNELLEGEEAEAEVDKVIGEILKGEIQTPGTQLPSQPFGPIRTQPEEEEEEELDSEEMLAQMRGRLEALKS